MTSENKIDEVDFTLSALLKYFNEAFHCALRIAMQ